MKNLIKQIVILAGFLLTQYAYADFGHYHSQRNYGDHSRHHWIDAWQDKQHRKIEMGYKHGQLTHWEYQNLRGGQRRVAHLKKRFERDRHFSRYEKLTLVDCLEQADNLIYRFNNNSYYNRYKRSWGYHKKGKNYGRDDSPYRSKNGNGHRRDRSARADSGYYNYNW